MEPSSQSAECNPFEVSNEESSPLLVTEEKMKDYYIFKTLPVYVEGPEQQ